MHILEKLLRDLNTLKENPELSLGNDLLLRVEVLSGQFSTAGSGDLHLFTQECNFL